MLTRPEYPADDNLSNLMERTPNPRIVSRTCTDVFGMEMLGDTGLGHADLHPEDKSHHDNTSQEKGIGVLCIPKTEPADVFDQTIPMDEEALTDQNLSRTLIPFATPYKLKDPVIVLERCDKIWQTLTLIKNAQSGNYSADSDTEESRHEEEDATEDRNPSPRLAYVQYEPVLENNNANFKLSVKTTERLYNCVSCGNSYVKKRYLRAHVYKVHGMPMPVNDFEQNDNKDSGVKIAKVRPTQRSKNHHKTSEGMEEFEKVQEPISGAECELGQEKGWEEVYVTCLLCNFHIKDLKKHLSSYHKIPHSEIMILSQYCKPISPGALKRIAIKNQYRKKDKTKASLEKSDAPINPIADHGESVTSRKRRSSEPSQAEPKRRHTGDNTNILERQNVVKLPSSKTDPSLQRREQSKSAETLVNQGILSSESKSKTNSTVKDTSGESGSELANGKTNDRLNGVEETPDTTCVCGRSFRTVYTFSSHKSRCSISSCINGIERPTDSDQGPSMGLNFTIKKHNNSYEIVGRAASDNDMSHSADATKALNGISSTPEMQGGVIEKHLGEYSKDHTFVKLEVVDEDITVDIEDDITNSSDDLKLNVIATEAAQETDIAGKENVQDGNVTRNAKIKQIKYQQKRHKIFVNDIELKPLTNSIKYICLCGLGYQTEQSLKDHIQKDHALCFRKCAYCKMIFKNMNELNGHSCLVIKGEPFRNLMKIPCSYCNMILNGNTFDEHICAKHLGSLKTLFKCYECVSFFPDSQKRQRHMTRFHYPRPCDFCSKSFKSKARTKHDAYHFGLGFPCHDCKLAYPTSPSLKEHREYMHIKRRNPLS